METRITQVINMSGSTETRSSAVRVILIVHDPLTRRVSLNSLERMGHSVHLLDDRTESHDQIDLILLDLELSSETWESQ